MRRFFLLILVVAISCTIIFVALELLSPNDRSSVTSPGDVTYYPNAYTDIAPILQGIYDADHDTLTSPPTEVLRGLVVPHHLTASMTIARGVKQMQHQSIKKILLLSPDHFFQCPTLLCTANTDFETFFGNAQADPSTVRVLQASEFVSDAPELFKGEHGIFAVLPFIKFYAPEISITPLVISQKGEWKSHQGELLDLIGSVVDDETLLVLSSDFSHYLSLDEANKMDALTQSAIEATDLDAITNLHNANQSDCPNGLWVLAALAQKRGFANPNIIAHTNSATILNDPAASSTTSHFAITWR